MNKNIKSLADRMSTNHYKDGMWVGVRNIRGSHISFKILKESDMKRLTKLIHEMELED